MSPKVSSAVRRLAPGQGLERWAAFTIEVDGEHLPAAEGSTVAAVLMASNQRVFRSTPRLGAPRGFFCGMGVCYDCLVGINGRPNVRACMTPAVPGMQVTTVNAGAVRPGSGSGSLRNQDDEADEG
jgi:predicted molibdopterin-dependent oxidoreductase YjgC